MTTWYRDSDAGFPALAYIPSPANVLSRFTNIKVILKACLVTGYGSKAGAGWTLIDEGDLYIVLRNASGGYVSLIDDAAYSGGDHRVLNVYLSASYEGMANNVPQGVGVTTGAGGLAARGHRWGVGAYVFCYPAPITVVADERSCVLNMFSSPWSSLTDGNGSSCDSQAATLYLGDDTAGFFVAVGGDTYNTYPNSMNVISVLSNPGTGEFVGGNAALLRNSLYRVGNYEYLSTETITDAISQSLSAENLVMCPVRWMCNGSPGGSLRGIFTEPLLGTAFSYATYNFLHGAGLPLAQIHIGIVSTPAIIDGYRYAALGAYPSRRLGGTIMTDNVEAWSWSPL